MGELWFGGFKRHSGFSKDSSVQMNLNVMYANAKLSTPEKRWRRVGRQANVLANLTKDKATEKKARAVAKAAFRKLAKLQEK
jgi:hypothetical protein